MTAPRRVVFRTRAAVALAVVLALTLLAGSCRRRGPIVVLYVSADEHIAREVVAAFEAQTGIDVQMVGDTEAKKTTGLVQRLRAEADHPQADVFWSSEIFQTIALAEEGVLEPHQAPALADWPKQYRDEQGRWYGFAGRARVIVYAPQRVAPDAVPRTWTDLVQRRWGGRLVMADPRFGTTGGHLAAMKVWWDRSAPGMYTAFLLGLRDNDVRMLPGGNAAVVQAIVDGEADVGMTDTDDVWAFQAQGHDVQMVYAAHSHEQEEGNGTLLIPNTVSMVRGAPHKAEAARLIEFLLSEPCERMLAESASRNVPLGHDRAASFPSLAIPDPLRVSYSRAAAARPTAVREAMEVLTASGADEP